MKDLAHIAIDKTTYTAVAAYAKACGFTARRFIEHAALYALNTQANRTWQDIFSLTASQSTRPHDLAADCARAAAKSEKLPEIGMEDLLENKNDG